MPIVPEPKKISRYDGAKLARRIMAHKVALEHQMSSGPAEAMAIESGLMEYLKHLATKYQIDFKTHGINSKGEIVKIPGV